MNIVYPAVLHRENDSYWIEFPDLEGCQSFGDTLAETIENGKEALAGYCLTLIDEKRRLPAPRDIDKISVGKDESIAVIETNLTDITKSVKKTLTIPAWLNTVAEEAHLNFSQILQNGIKKELNIQ